MINTNRLLKVSVVWTSVAYVVCYAVVAFFPGIRDWFWKYSLHSSLEMGENYLTTGSFVWGLIFWNIIALLSVWLFAALWNGIKK